MGLFDKIKGFIGDPEEEDDLDMEMDDEMDFVSKNEDSTEAFSASTDTTKRNNKVVNIHATAQLQVVLVNPSVLMTPARWPITSMPSGRWC